MTIVEDPIPKKLTRYDDNNDRLTMILLGANGSLANHISTTQKRMKSTKKEPREPMVSLSVHKIFPPLSRPNRRKNVEETRVSAPKKSTRLNLAQKSASGASGSLRANATATMAMAVNGTWSRNDLEPKYALIT